MARVFRIVSHRQMPPTLGIEDLCSVAVTELQRQLARWGEGRAAFMTFARYRVDGAIKDALKREYGSRRAGGVHIVSGIRLRREGMTLPATEVCDARDYCAWALSMLSEVERRVIHLLYWEELTPGEAAARMRRSVCSIHEVRRRAFRKVRARDDKRI